MSDFANTPETYVAWRYLEVTDELRPYDGELAEMLRGKEELGLFLADLEKSPTVDNIERFFKRSLELRCSTQRSLARSLEQYRCRSICIADLEARPDAYSDLGTEEENRQRAAALRRSDGELAPLVAKIEEGQRSRAENENLLAALDALIASRHAYGENEQSEPDTSRG